MTGSEIGDSHEPLVLPLQSPWPARAYSAVSNGLTVAPLALKPRSPALSLLWVSIELCLATAAQLPLGDQLLADLVGGRLVLDQHVADVDLEEVVLALVEGAAQLGVGRVRDQLDRDQVDRQLDPLLGAEHLLGDLPGLQQLLVVLALGRHLLLELLHAGVDVGLLDGHAVLLGPVQHQLELDQALQRLAGRPLDVLGLLLALLLGLAAAGPAGPWSSR